MRYLKVVSLRFSSTSQVSLRELYPFQRIRYSFLGEKYTQNFLVYGWNLTYATHFKQASNLLFLYFVCNSTIFQLENKGFSFLSIYSPWNPSIYSPWKPFERFFLRPSAILNTEIYAPAVQAGDCIRFLVMCFWNNILRISPLNDHLRINVETLYLPCYSVWFCCTLFLLEKFLKTKWLR